MTRLKCMVSLIVTGVFCGTALANPVLTPGVWTDIGPQWIAKGAPQTMIAQGIAVDPKNPSIIYWGNTPFNTSPSGGLFKSTNAGSTWSKIGKATSPTWMGNDSIDEPLRIRIDPNNSQHLYVGDGVRGGSQGFFVSTDGGATFNKPQGWANIENSAGWIGDVYDVAVDPTDFNHVLTAGHSTGHIMESKDGGTTWITHAGAGWGAGNCVKFLYNPSKGVGNSQTWLVGTQSGGFFRTTDSGTNWTKVSDNTIFHGGGSSYYSKTGVLYVSGYPTCQRSTDNGLSWTSIASAAGGTTCLYGDGTRLYTAFAYGGGNESIYTSSESDGITWTAGTQQFNGSGPYEMAYDSVNGIMYASMWYQGVWAMKLPGTGVRNPLSHAQVSNQSFASPARTLAGDHALSTLGISGSSGVYDVKGRCISRSAAGSAGHWMAIVKTR